MTGRPAAAPMLLLAACGALLAGCGPSNATGPAGTTTPPASQAAWLEPHNAVRAGTFQGITVSPSPSPALPALGWSDAAATVAQAWASGCRFQHNPGRGADGTPRGENIAAYAPAGQAAATPAGVVKSWGGEWSAFDYAANACASGQVCGHYTQLVWRGTTRVGCARATCSVNSPFSGAPTWDFFVCDYEPPGNWSGQRPY